jgi:hypothetical protein
MPGTNPVETPAPVGEGITATKDFVNFWKGDGSTLFHVSP